tara:strand:+ start:9729 stop:9959 length:231 start_codon:yes stop_codon:yes gene_type:complete
MTPIIAALQGLASLPKLVDQINSLVSQLGALEKRINEAQVVERMANKRARNRAAIERVLASREDGQGAGADKPPTV